MKRIVRLTESDLVRLVKRVISEDTGKNIVVSFANPQAQTSFIEKFGLTDLGNGNYNLQLAQSKFNNDPYYLTEVMAKYGNEGKLVATKINEMLRQSSATGFPRSVIIMMGRKKTGGQVGDQMGQF